MLKFIFMDFMEPTEVRFSLGPTAALQVVGHGPHSLLQFSKNMRLFLWFLFSQFSALATTCCSAPAPHSCQREPGRHRAGTGSL